MTNRRSSTIHDARYGRLIEILINRRSEAGISQAALASTLGICQPDVSKVERFVRRIDALEFFDWVIALGALTNCDPEEILGDLYLCASRPRQREEEA
jgi:hypothetical protein